MFGKKRQHAIIESIKRLEDKTDKLYHFMSSDMADIQEQLEELNDIISTLDINTIIETLQYFNQSTNYISEILTNASFEVESPTNEDNLNGTH